MSEELLTRIRRAGVIVICRKVYGQELFHLAQSLYRGGIRQIEVTFDQSDPLCITQTAEAIEMLCRAFPDMDPTLAMICSRYKENRDFVSTPYWQLHITLERLGEFRQFSHIEDFKSKEQAEVAHARFSPDSMALITKVERKRTYQQAPLLYDLTTLQKDCNIHHDMTAEKTLSVAQSLYEKKYISYPRTGSRYISHDMMEQVYDSLWKVATMPEFKEYGKRFDFEHLNMRSVDDDKVTDHHALIITGVEPEELNAHEQIVYTMIAGRMLEAFSPRCEKESLVMEATTEDMKFRSRSTTIVNPGWRGVFARKEDAEKDETEANKGTAHFAEGEQIPVTGYGTAQRKTMPKPLYTEATLLAAIETCGIPC